MTTRLIDRRRFLGAGATLTAAAALEACRAPAALTSRSPNDEIRVAVIGLRGRGGDHIRAFSSLEGVRLVALADVDSEVLDRRVAELDRRGIAVDGVRDCRRLLDRDDIDAVSIATPNHWHALQAIWACQAGKDVYVEKPISHNVFEGRQLVTAAARYRRMVQCGTQCRSSDALAEAFEWTRAGNLGRIELVRGLCYKRRPSIGKVAAPVAPPASVDYDLWTGPAPLVPLQRQNLHYDWHWVFATGNGDLGNQGVHQMDLCRWLLGDPGLPRAVFAFGGRFGYDDDGDTPNTQVTWLDYAAAPVVFEVRGLPRDKDSYENNGLTMDERLGVQIGVVAHCEGGALCVPGYDSALARDRDGKIVKSFRGARDHYRNFIDAVRSRRGADLAADAATGHVSAALCHLGNISYQVGAAAGGEAPAAAPVAALAEVGEMARHLERLAILGSRIRFGAWLEIDARRERFARAHGAGAAELAAAQALLTREYRAPFVVPARV